MESFKNEDNINFERLILDFNDELKEIETFTKKNSDLFYEYISDYRNRKREINTSNNYDNSLEQAIPRKGEISNLFNVKKFITEDFPAWRNLIREDMYNFVQLQKVLKDLLDLDKKFKKLIEQYRNTNKFNSDYIEIKTELLSYIDNEYHEEDEENNISYYIFSLSIREMFRFDYRKESLSNLYYYFYNIIFACISDSFRFTLDFIAFYLIKSSFNVDETIRNHDNLISFFNSVQNKSEDLSLYLKEEYEFTFLSYAFTDWFLTILLFIHAKKNGIILYIDWMYQAEMVNVAYLRNKLSYFISQSNNLLFLKTMNSELKIPVNEKNKKISKMLRQWCSWEMGVFHKNNENDNEKNIKIVDLSSDDSVKELFVKNKDDNFFISDLERISTFKSTK